MMTICGLQEVTNKKSDSEPTELLTSSSTVQQEERNKFHISESAELFVTPVHYWAVVGIEDYHFKGETTKFT
jgi:hypothetical protein